MGLGQHDLTCSGQGDFAFTSVEELGADIFFDPLDRLTQRRLRHVEPFRGAAKIQLFGDGNELAHLSEINHNMILKIYQKHFKQILDISKGMRI